MPWVCFDDTIRTWSRPSSSWTTTPASERRPECFSQRPVSTWSPRLRTLLAPSRRHGRCDPRSSCWTSSFPTGTASTSLAPSWTEDDPPIVILISSREAADYGTRIDRSGARGFISKAELSVGAITALVRGDPWSRRRRVALWSLALAIAVVGDVGFLVYGAAPFGGNMAFEVSLDVAVGFATMAAGIVTWSRRPKNRIGPMLFAAGAAWSLSGLYAFGFSYQYAAPGDTHVFTDPLLVAGTVLLPLHYAIVLHLLLAYPEGVLHGRLERALVVGGVRPGGAPDHRDPVGPGRKRPPFPRRHPAVPIHERRGVPLLQPGLRSPRSSSSGAVG